jgi:hypothetical protein
MILCSSFIDGAKNAEVLVANTDAKYRKGRESEPSTSTCSIQNIFTQDLRLSSKFYNPRARRPRNYVSITGGPRDFPLPQTAQTISVAYPALNSLGTRTSFSGDKATTA